MRKISICSSGARRIAGVDLELDLELAVGGEELDVAAEAPRRTGAVPLADESARIAKRASCCASSAASFKLRRDLLDRRTGLEHRGVRRDGEEILREAVVDLARHARSLLGDRAAELGEADRAPRADEDHGDTRACAGSRPARRSVLASSGWNTRWSAAKSISVKPSASQRARSSPACGSARPSRRPRRARSAPAARACRVEAGRAAAARRRPIERRERTGRARSSEPGDERARRPLRRPRRRSPSRGRRLAAADERRDGDETPGRAIPPSKRRPGLGPVERRAAERRDDRKGRPRRATVTKKPLASRRSSRAALDREADGGEQRRRGARRAPSSSGARAAAAAGRSSSGGSDRRRKQREAGAEEAREEDLAQEPGLIARCAVPHIPLVGRTAAADKGRAWRRAILIVDDHPLTREALSSLLRAHGFDVAGRHPTARRRSWSRRGLAARPGAARSLDARHGRPHGAAPAARGGARVRGRRPHGVRDRGEPPCRDPRRSGRLPPEDRASGADRRFLEGVANGEAALSGSVARRLLDQVRVPVASGTACPTRSPRLSRRASSRCCSCSTTISAPTRSRSGSSSPSTRSART